MDEHENPLFFFITKEEIFLEDVEQIINPVKTTFAPKFKHSPNFLPGIQQIHQLTVDLLQGFKFHKQDLRSLVAFMESNLPRIQQCYKLYLQYYMSSKEKIKCEMLSISQPINIDTISTPARHCKEYCELLKAILKNGIAGAEQASLQFSMLINRQDKILIIAEYFDTEQNYLQDLAWIKDKLKPAFSPLLANNCPEFLRGIEQIYELTSAILVEMQDRGGRGITPTAFSQVIIEYGPALRLYSDYLKNFGISSEWITKVKYTGQLDISQASAKIGNPTKRTFSYKSFTERLLKKAKEGSQEYVKAKQADSLLESVIRHNDDILTKVENDMHVLMLHEKYGKILFNDKGQKRIFIRTQKANLLKENKSIEVKMHVFKDLLFFQEQSNNIGIHLPVNSRTYVSPMPDTKFFKQIISITNEKTSLLIICETDSKKDQLIYFLEELIGGSEAIQIHVLGSEQMFASQFTKHTVYIIEVKHGLSRQLLYKRYSQIKKMLKELGKPTNQFHSHTFKKMKSKIIDARKQQISSTLKALISETKDEMKTMLLKLGVNESFFGQGTVDPRQTIPDLADHSLAAIFARCFTVMGRSSWAHNQTQQEEQNLTKEEGLLSIYLPFEFVVKVTRLTMAREIIRKVKQQLKLKCVLDYKLCMEIGMRENRVLDEDELIWPYYQLVKQENQWLITKVFEAAKDAYFSLQKPIICFKKVLFLPFRYQMPELKNDPQRLRVLAYQLFREVRQMKFYLNFDSYCLLIALHCMYQQYQNNKQVENIQEIVIKYKNINTTLPKIIKETHEIGEWKEGATLVLDKLRNRSIIRSASDLELILINRLKNHVTYGATLYYIQLHQTMEKHLIQLSIQYTYNMWLSIKFEGLALLQPANKKVIFQISYLELQKATALCSSIQLIVGGKSLRLNTDQGYEISYLVSIYQQLNYEVSAL